MEETMMGSPERHEPLWEIAKVLARYHYLGWYISVVATVILIVLVRG